jgi:uncharacterized YccA/Bax inhibitor family protein
VPGLRPPDEDRIPVAAPRPPRVTRTPRPGVVDATGAGLTVIVVAAVVGVLGRWLGGRVGVPWAGTMTGAFVGLMLGLWAIYLRYRSV